jgi:transposase
MTTGKNNKKGRRKYDASFKEDVLRMIASGRTVSEVAEALGIGTHIIYRWISIAKNGDIATNTPANPFISENERLKAELHRTQQERDILKKALGIFSRGN